MPEPSATPSSGLKPSLTATALQSKRRLKPPSDLVIKATKPTTIYPKDGSEPASSCQTCNKTLPRNPRLCDDCQVWNDTHHVFNCLSTAKLDNDLDERQPVTLGQMLARNACLMCRTVSEGALDSLSVDANSLNHQLLDVEIRNYGPFCLSKSQYGTLNPALPIFSNTSMPLHLIEPNDLRFTGLSSLPDLGEERLAPIRTVTYIVLTAPLGSDLCSQFPHLDEYKISDKAKKHWSDDKRLGAHRSTGPGNPDELLQPTFGLQVDLTYEKKTTGLIAVVRWNDEFINTAQFRGLLTSCEAAHEDELKPGSIKRRKCSLDADPEPLPAGFRVIDTLNYCVIELPSCPLSRYVTLSYTWGGTPEVKELQLERSNQDELYQPGCLKMLGGIPDLILDAMKFCANMGERYLWVDRLCIVQDELEAKMEQINAMDRIYHLASFTLIAAVPPDIGLPGVVGRPRRSHISNRGRIFHPKYRFIVDNFNLAVTKSFWNSRGWTYQEFTLSRRAIYVTEWQAYWICNRHSSQEELGEIMTTTSPWDLHKLSNYMPTIADYTSRNLSFESDILNAFAGIGNQFAKKMGKPLLYGLPERYLSRALLWEQTKTIEERKAAVNIPSWSWAAWRGRVLYELNSRAEKSVTGTLVRFYIVENDRSLRQIMEDETWFFKDVDLGALGTLPMVDPLYPEMRYMPTRDASLEWRASIQSPWTIATHGRIDEEEVRASCRPGRLIFRTTSAHVRLRVPASPSYKPIADYTKLEICNQDGLVVGELANLPQDWIGANIRFNQDHEVLVITAGIASEYARYTQTHTTLNISGEYQQPKTEDSLWYLHVMLIGRNDDGVARRIAIGTVELKLWMSCNPRWLTVILA